MVQGSVIFKVNKNQCVNVGTEINLHT